MCKLHCACMSSDFKHISSNVEDFIGELPETSAKAVLGRPPMFSSVDVMQEKIEEYFTVVIGPKQLKDEYGELMWTGTPKLDTDGRVLRDGAKRIIYEEETKRPVLAPARPPTVAGLALYLGFADYAVIYHGPYKDKPEFAALVKRAIGRISEYAQEQLFIGSSKGATFWLKNHGWSDIVKTELSGRDGAPIETKDTSAKSREILMHFVNNHGNLVK